MLPRAHKLANSADFRRVMRKGVRAGTRTVVVHYFPRTDLAVTGPRFGLVVSKQVGNAVTRHRISRQLRHILSALASSLEPQADIVVRALPASAGASSEQLLDDVSSATTRAKQKAAGQ